ncbi:MAG: response regulator transcription factor [Gammaproteobacteria bacterium]
MSAGTVFVVEDDDALADALAFLLESRDLAVKRYDSAEAFLRQLQASPGWPEQPACLLLDVRMRGMSGLELFDLLQREHPGLAAPVVFLSGHGDIRMAVDAVKRGAFDFFEKPFSDNRLADRLIEALGESARRIAAARGAASVESRLARLSAREREVMDRVLEGRSNKLIAQDLGISMRTVEVHRSNVFAKMEVRSAVELARLLSPGEG